MPYPVAGATDAVRGLDVSDNGGSVLGGVGGDGGAGGIGRGIPQTMTLFLPEERPIPSAQLFNTLGQKSTVAGGSGILIPDAGIQLPQGCVARIDSVTLYVTNLLATSDLTFSVFADNAPLPGLQNVGIFPGVAARVAENFGGLWRVPSGVALKVQFTNNDGGSYLVGAALSGWYWPESMGSLYLRQGQQ